MKKIKMIAGLIAIVCMMAVAISCVSTGGSTADKPPFDPPKIEGLVPYDEAFLTGFTGFGPGHIEAASGGKPISFFASSDAADGDSSVGVKFAGDAWALAFVFMDKNTDMRDYTTLSFKLKTGGKIEDVGVKAEGPRGKGVELKLSKYKPVEEKDGWKLYKIPLADFVMDLKNVRIPFAVANAKNAGGSLVGGIVLFDAISYE